MAKRSKLFSVILLGLAAVLAYNAFQSSGETAATQGHLVSSRTESNPVPPVKGRYGPLVSPIRYQTVSWTTYSYEVDGKLYTHEALASKVPPGSSFQVYYNPNHPAWVSVDRPSPPILSISLAVLALLGFVVLVIRSSSP